MYWVKHWDDALAQFETLEEALEYIKEDIVFWGDFGLDDYKLIKGEELNLKLNIAIDITD
jgi:predicted RNase H-like HicB family nuclease